MNVDELIVGEWYWLDIGYSKVKGRLIDTVCDGGMFCFYWGKPLRSAHYVSGNDIIKKANKPPKWFSNV